MAVKNTKPFAVKGATVTTPKGKAEWCKITEPDRMYNDKGELSTSLVCDPNDPTVQEFISKLETLRDLAFEETKETLGMPKANQVKTKEVYSEQYNSNGEATGNIIFKMKLKDIDTRKERGDQHTIFVVDAKRSRMADVPLVGNGSEIRCVCYANPYYMANTKEVGISMIWSKMQLIKLVEYTGGGADDFEDEEGFEDPKVDSDFSEEDDF